MGGMSAPAEDFAVLLDRAARGDEAAARTVVARYENIIRRAARGRLGPAMRPCLDSMDVVQSVHRSLLIGLRFDKFQITHPEQLIALALKMVQRKVARQWLKLRRHPVTETALATDSAVRPLDAVPGREADPAEGVAAGEQVRRVLATLPLADRRLVELRLEGRTTAEAARHLGVDPVTLRVRLARLRQRLHAAGVTEEWL